MPATSLSTQASAVIFLVLRRMRIPLIALICIFTISVLGLELIPGGTPEEPWQMDFFTAFYVISYTVTTIGFGEIPHAYNDDQRMWITLSIYLGVIGWAYAIGSLLALLQDRGFKQALALQRFRRKVHRLHEPFWLIAGHGVTGELVGKRLDALFRRFVAVDHDEVRIDLLELGSYNADVPGLVADARRPDVLTVAGLGNPNCAGVLALTDDEEANLAVVMAARTISPSVPVIARASSPTIKLRMSAAANPTIIDPFDRFGDHFRVELRAPATEQLSHWLVDEAGAPLPKGIPHLGHGHWILCGYGRFGRELVRDMGIDGIPVRIVDDNPAHPEPNIIRRDLADPDALREAGIDSAIGIVAGTDNDITNLSIVVSARHAKPGIFVVARQNQPVNAELFAALDIDLLMQPTLVTAEEAISYLSTPMLHQFLTYVAQQDDEWSAALIARLQRECGEGSPELSKVTINANEAPALLRRMQQQPAIIGDLLRDPEDREARLHIVVLLVDRHGDFIPTPGDDFVLAPDDALLLAARPRAISALDGTLAIDSTTSYVFTGHAAPTSWVMGAIFDRTSQK